MDNLTIAITNNDVEKVKLILNDINFNDLNSKNSINNTPFFISCLYGNIEIVKLIINDKNLNSLNEKNIYGDSALSASCFCGYTNIVKLILNHPSFDIKSLNDENMAKHTPFSLAYYCGHINVIKELLKNKNIIIPKTLPILKLENIKNLELLMEEYELNPKKMRMKLIINEKIHVYNNIIFIMNDNLKIKKS